MNEAVQGLVHLHFFIAKLVHFIDLIAYLTCVMITGAGWLEHRFPKFMSPLPANCKLGEGASSIVKYKATWSTTRILHWGTSQLHLRLTTEINI